MVIENRYTHPMKQKENRKSLKKQSKTPSEENKYIYRRNSFQILEARRVLSCTDMYSSFLWATTKQYKIDFGPGIEEHFKAFHGVQKVMHR